MPYWNICRFPLVELCCLLRCLGTTVPHIWRVLGIHCELCALISIVIGPKNRLLNEGLLERPRFPWDINSVPWTDGQGDKKDFADAVDSWCAFHDNLPDFNCQIISKTNRGIVLRSHCYARAKDLCDALPMNKLWTGAGIDFIVSATYNRGPLTAVSNVHSELYILLSTKQAPHEAWKHFESQIAAQLSRFNAFSSKTAIQGAMAWLVLVINALADTPQWVAILADASPNKADMTSNVSTDEMLDQMNYKSGATVLQQCDETDKSSRHYRLLTSSSAMISPCCFNARSHNSQRNRPKRKHI